MPLMHYGRALEFLIMELVIANPELGHVQVLKADVSEGFYHVGINPIYATKMGIVFFS